jgi:hypothetical protein
MCSIVKAMIASVSKIICQAMKIINQSGLYFNAFYQNRQNNEEVLLIQREKRAWGICTAEN